MNAHTCMPLNELSLNKLQNRFAAFALGASTLIFASGCQRYIDVNLTLVEPCDQRDQALNGINTFQVTVDVGNGTEPVVTRFSANEAAPPLEAPIGEGTIVTVQAWTSSDSVPNTLPDAIGRTVPLALNENAPADITLLTGRRDSIGEVADVEGSCQKLNNGESIAGRHGHTVTFIPGTSLVLIVGGAVWADNPQVPGERQEVFLKTAEIWDSATGTITAVSDPDNQLIPRAYHTATALSNGTVLVSGGFAIINQRLQALSSGFLFDPARLENGAFSPVVLRQARAHHTATYLEESELVVLIGGCDGPGCGTDRVFDASQLGDPAALLTTVEVYSVTDKTSVLGEGLREPRAMHAASAFTRQVVVSGGVNGAGLVCSLEVFAANGNTVNALPLEGTFSTLSPCPARHQQVTVAEVPGNNRIAIIGGFVEADGGKPGGAPTANVTFWNTSNGVESPPSSLISGRGGHLATKLQDGSIFVYGGTYAQGGAPAERLVIQLDGLTYQPTALTVPPAVATDRAAMTMLPNNQVFIAGGHSVNQVSSDIASLYFGE